jgi:L-threonylcarbamoyladenylate synthase
VRLSVLMKATVLPIDPRSPDAGVIEHAARVLLRGGLVAFPTETVYGLGALADQPETIQKIYAAKGRPAYNPLIAHVPDENAARIYAESWPEAASHLAKAFWPGPLTLVVPRGNQIPPELSAGLGTVALRAPRHPVALALLRAVGRPIAAPSANPSNELSPTRAEHVVKGLGDRVDLILDAGPCALGIESTVVDVSHVPAVILRPGSLGLADLRTILAPIVATSPPTEPEGKQRPSPGLDRRHYAPRATLRIAERSELLALVQRAPRPVGLATLGVPMSLHGVHERTLPDDPVLYAAALFDTLHALDDAGCRTIALEAVPTGPGWEAVRDRLARASA